MGLFIVAGYRSSRGPGSLLRGHGVDGPRRPWERRSRDVACGPASHNVLTLEVDPDHVGAVRLQLPQLAPAASVPEPQQAITAAGYDHGAIGGDRRVGEEPCAALIRLTKPARFSVP